MNEKIKKLYAASLEPGGEDLDGYRLEFNVELFAELIAQECYQICMDNVIPEVALPDFNYNDGVEDCASIIKQRFGLE